MDSPPKRMTRSRAAARTAEPAVKTTKIVTAAAKAKGTATASTKSTAAKRKTRADEHEEVDEAPALRRVRGRPKKTEEPEIEVPVTRSARTRTVKKTTARVTREEPATSSSTAPAKPTRGRPRKAVAEAPVEEPVVEPEPAKKTTRTRAATATTTTTTTTTATTTKTSGAAKSGVKKSVKFQEPDKENIEPTPGAKEPAVTGLRGRPARRGVGTATAARSTKATPKATEPSRKKPLSPKKVTQLSALRDESEDELAGEMTPVKPMMKSPIKPPSNLNLNTKQDAFCEEPVEPTVVDAVLDAPNLGAGMVSPAKRPPASPFRDAMKSPAKRIGAIPLPPGSALKPVSQSTEQAEATSPFKASLLQSAAKRPQSPIKGLNFASTTVLQQTQSAMKASLFQSPAKRAFPGMVPLAEPRCRDFPAPGETSSVAPIVMSTPTPTQSSRPSDKLMLEDEVAENVEVLADDIFNEPIENLEFPGRLSALLPRHADPAWKKDMGIVDEPKLDAQAVAEPSQVTEEEIIAPEILDSEENVPEEVTEDGEKQADLEFALEEAEDHMIVDEELADLAKDTEEAEEEESLTPPQSPAHQENPMFQLRERDLDPCRDMDSESEDEMEPPVAAAAATESTLARQTPKAKDLKARVSLSGFTPLAEQLGSWSAASPVKLPQTKLLKTMGQSPTQQQAATPHTESSLVMNNFFEDEMLVRPDTQEMGEESAGEVMEEPSFNDIMVTDEDVALAHEANEMSLMEPEQMEDVVNTSFDDTLSEASQEYGDENEVPIDPAIIGSVAQAPPVTPVRPVMKSFHTTTKVPLKPADDSTPSPIKKRCFSASRVAPKRPSGQARNATAVSHSPAKDRRGLPGSRPESAPGAPEPATPSKADLWSAIGTPARTPRRDLNPSMLRGAVVHVDVHTSEGADASGIFVELLTQMGAKCMKTWNWQPDGEDGESSSDKIGITHVVFKDGGERTLEKVRQTSGVVQCVGVGWVLDCERENEWLDEAPYYIDTSSEPRGGARRRKSMEPKALASLNGALGSSPVRGQTRDSRTAPNTPKNRRESSAWMYTPSEQDDAEEMDEYEWPNALLTPVPKTPAPDAVARYAANIVPETPSAADEDELEEDESPTKQALLTRTCPPKNAYREMGHGILSQDRDEQLMQRLMLARRKSLQFAPKIGSPLARAWK